MRPTTAQIAVAALTTGFAGVVLCGFMASIAGGGLAFLYAALSSVALGALVLTVVAVAWIPKAQAAAAAAGDRPDHVACSPAQPDTDGYPGDHSPGAWADETEDP